MIYVFKTSVKTKKIVNALKPKLDNLIPDKKWSFDLEDCDKILRIDCFTVTAGQVMITTITKLQLY